MEHLPLNEAPNLFQFTFLHAPHIHYMYYLYI